MKYLITIFSILFITLKVAWASVSITNGLTHFHSGRAGDLLYGEVVLVNTSNKTQRVKFDLSEVQFSVSGQRSFTNTGSHPQSASTWFESETMNKVLGPFEKYVYRYNLRIPRNQVLNGSFWTVLMVAVEKPIAEQALTNQVGIDTKVRYAVGLLVNVNELDEVSLDFESVDMTNNPLEAQKALDIEIKNLGAFIEKVALTLEVYDASGKKVKAVESDRKLVFPGICKNFRLDISQLPIGEYQCLLLADTREQFAGTNLSLSISK